MIEQARSGLVWGVRSSFVEYVRDFGGTVELSEGAGTIATGEYYFALADATAFDPETGRGTLRFRGQVHFQGHHGMLSVAIADPSVTFGDSSCTLDVTTDGGPLKIVELHLGQSNWARGDLRWDAIPSTLAATAVTTFNDSYPAGTMFDPVSIRLERSA